jgi:hypothetical protein
MKTKLFVSSYTSKYNEKIDKLADIIKDGNGRMSEVVDRQVKPMHQHFTHIMDTLDSAFPANRHIPAHIFHSARHDADRILRALDEVRLMQMN